MGVATNGAHDQVGDADNGLEGVVDVNRAQDQAKNVNNNPEATGTNESQGQAKVGETDGKPKRHRASKSLGQPPEPKKAKASESGRAHVKPTDKGKQKAVEPQTPRQPKVVAEPTIMYGLFNLPLNVLSENALLGSAGSEGWYTVVPLPKEKGDIGCGDVPNAGKLHVRKTRSRKTRSRPPTSYVEDGSESPPQGMCLDSSSAYVLDGPFNADTSHAMSLDGDPVAHSTPKHGRANVNVDFIDWTRTPQTNNSNRRNNIDDHRNNIDNHTANQGLKSDGRGHQTPLFPVDMPTAFYGHQDPFGDSLDFEDAWHPPGGGEESLGGSEFESGSESDELDDMAEQPWCPLTPVKQSTRQRSKGKSPVKQDVASTVESLAKQDETLTVEPVNPSKAKSHAVPVNPSKAKSHAVPVMSTKGRSRVMQARSLKAKAQKQSATANPQKTNPRLKKLQVEVPNTSPVDEDEPMTSAPELQEIQVAEGQVEEAQTEELQDHLDKMDLEEDMVHSIEEPVEGVPGPSSGRKAIKRDTKLQAFSTPKRAGRDGVKKRRTVTPNTFKGGVTAPTVASAAKIRSSLPGKLTPGELTPIMRTPGKRTPGNA